MTLASWFSPHPNPRSLDGGTSNRAVSSGRCSPMTLSVFSQFGGEAGLAGLIGASGPGSTVFLFENIDTEM